jgi:hypothetical protein
MKEFGASNSENGFFNLLAHSIFIFKFISLSDMFVFINSLYADNNGFSEVLLSFYLIS